MRVDTESTIQVDPSMVLRYVIPFAFSAGYQSQCQVLDEAEKWKRCRWTDRASAVYAHLYDSVYGDPERSMGSSWQYDFHNKRPLLRYQPGTDENKFCLLRLTAAGIHLFQTNVGLLWYEVTVANKKEVLSLAELTRLQNRFKDCSSTGKSFSMERPRHSKTEQEFDPLDMARWTEELLRPLGQLYYLNGSCLKDGRVCPDKALIFNYALLKGEKNVEEAQLQIAAFRLANGYTEKYFPSQEALEVAIHPFQDVCIYASRSGCGFYAIENEGNGAFYSGNFNQNIRDEYFFLYILTLYQSFSLMNYARISAIEYPSDPEQYHVASQIGLRLNHFLAELNTFLMKGIYTSVSSVQHHNEFYNYLKKRLMIYEDIESIKIGTEALGELQHMLREQEEAKLRAQEDDERVQQEQSLNIALAFLSLTSLFAVFQDMDDLIDRLRAVKFSFLWQSICSCNWTVIGELIIYLTVMVVVCLCIGTLVRNMLARRKRKKNPKKK